MPPPTQDEIARLTASIASLLTRLARRILGEGGEPYAEKISLIASLIEAIVLLLSLEGIFEIIVRSKIKLDTWGLCERGRTGGKSGKNRLQCADAVECLEKDFDDLLVHYAFPRGDWEALRTTNTIERVNKEFKRRSRLISLPRR